MNIIMFKKFVVTIHNGPIKSLDIALSKLKQGQLSVLFQKKITRKAEWVLYTLIDHSIDIFVHLCKQLEFEVEALGNLVLILSINECVKMTWLQE